MKLVGKFGATTLNLSGAAPNSALLITFQDTSVGRSTVVDALADAQGDALVNAPPNFGRTGYSTTIKTVDTGKSVDLVNDTAEDGTITLSEPHAQVEEAPHQPDRPVI